jgi:hypothetical protein
MARSTASWASNFNIPVPDDIQNIVTDLQITPEPSTLPKAHKNYIIHNQRTLELLPCVRAPLGAPPQSLPSSLAISDNPEPSKTGELSTYRQQVSSQQSGDSHLSHPRKPEDAALRRTDELGVNVLVLGISDSGKTTLEKSMKIAFDTAGKEWRLSYKPAIYMSLVLSLKHLASKTGRHEWDRMDMAEEDPWRYEIAKNYRIIDEWLLANAWALDETYSFTPSVASAVIDLSQIDDIRAIHNQMIQRSATEGTHPYITDCTQQ